MKIFTCEVCGKEFKRAGINPKAKFCSVSCKGLYQSIYNTGKNHPRWRDDFIRVKSCEYCGKEFTSDNPSSFQKMKFCSKKCADIGGFRYKGKQHPNWRGIRTEISRLRGQAEYKKWSKEIMIRDNYTCLICKKRGGTLHAHHIKSFTYYPELRYKLFNGVTLCSCCHAKLHRPKTGNKFSGAVENGVNSVELPQGQYRAEPEKEGVEVSLEITDTKTPSEQRTERYDPSLLATTGSEK